jgi:trehalose utilization protein
MVVALYPYGLIVNRYRRVGNNCVNVEICYFNGGAVLRSQITLRRRVG